MPVTDAVRTNGTQTVAASRAAAELVLKRGEFELAVHLGIVRVEAGSSGGRPRVRQEEVDRLRSEDGFPGTLRERVRTVGTAEGARLLGVSPVRFTRLARAGCVTPVALYLNRYRAVVWLYLAQELGGLAARSPELLVGRSPVWMRDRLDSGTDCRPRNWRSRRIERLLTLTGDPWARAAVVAQALDPAQLAEVVDDPYERAYFARVLPEPVFGQRGSSATRDALERLMIADEPDEILWRRVNLIMELDSARELRQAPRPGDEPRPGLDALGRLSVSAEPFEPAERVEPAEPGGSVKPGELTELGEPTEPTELGESAVTAEPARPVEPAAQGSSVGLLARLRRRRGSGGRPPRTRASREATRSAGRVTPGGRRPLTGPRGGSQREGAAGRE
ncbi:DUF6397 family protein [Streptomyces sp. NPDC048680]|uniref:DUF6397 family protein n=1 Tax=Streptomyces sp. NPDC048680 TaxID=3155492 RepID=UPI00344277A8